MVDQDVRSWSGSALVRRGGELVEEISTGSVAGVGTPPCSAGTRFQAGSISKQMMSVVFLALMGRGVVRLDEPIGRWLGGLPSPLRSITPAQLLSHTSGIGHWGDIPGLPPLLGVPPERDALVRLITDAPLVSAPGTSWRYSGPGFLLTGLVIEAVTGEAYGDVVAELVFSPAGMRATTSGQFPVGESGVALGHHGGRLIEVQEGFTHIPGTGDLWTTTADLLRYIDALRTGKLLDPATASHLWTRHAELDPPDPADQPTSASAYGYGTFLGRVLGHDAWYVPGDNPGYQSLLAHLPDLGVDLAVLGNEEQPGVNAVLSALTPVSTNSTRDGRFASGRPGSSGGPGTNDPRRGSVGVWRSRGGSR